MAQTETYAFPAVPTTSHLIITGYTRFQLLAKIQPRLTRQAVFSPFKHNLEVHRAGQEFGEPAVYLLHRFAFWESLRSGHILCSATQFIRDST